MRPFRLLVVLLLVTSCSAAAGNDSAGAATPPSGTGDAAAAGRYRLRGGPDVVSALELLPDGRFRYMMAAGALDAHAEGRWTSDGRTVTLNTEPRPVPPAFAAGPVSQSGDAPLVVFVGAPNGRGIAGIDLRLGFADGRTIEGYTQDYGWHYAGEEPPGRPAWVELSLAMHDVPPRRFALDASAGNRFDFTLTPNDLGVQDFRDQALEITGEGLVVSGPGGRGVYIREE